jgi:acyl carrier protein
VTTQELTRPELLGRITGILSEVIDNPGLKLSESTTADEVNDWDSINHVKLLIGLESDLGFRFETDEVSGLRKVGDLIDVIEKKLSQGKR